MCRDFGLRGWGEERPLPILPPGIVSPGATALNSPLPRGHDVQLLLRRVLARRDHDRDCARVRRGQRIGDRCRRDVAAEAERARRERAADIQVE